ncbi:hypothetical protein [Pseudomonas lactucae]|uniref:Uncharacterized protein n=1 Tax=Pseudomonas lactucae TaxID=2813360 RepID=A0A9X0YBY1_9PSED|nr:hypothetical protein [Pseudomonas lactucae]MBN2976464.1 hypothetical protein [Pseudomonas lactucae]MBN2988053.1 hypothetical protein [Pseudomonas lactucae]
MDEEDFVPHKKDKAAQRKLIVRRLLPFLWRALKSMRKSCRIFSRFQQN